ncbi:MAG TPA: MFS transporter [Caulobacteraceae bacterium]|jgi:SHS family lactate transporter-like MFS transporter
MVIIDDLRGLNSQQRSAFVAALLGWALDAFDYFLLVFVLGDIAKEFHADIAVANSAILLTLVARPFGALVFGRLADRFGRRPMLMTVVGLYSVLALASALSPTLLVLLVLRTCFGFAMGGVWGIGASLALETIPAKSRGVISGILQEGYPMGYFLAAIANLFLPTIGWRWLLALGILPALLIFYIHRSVGESPTWEAARAAKAAAPRTSAFAALKGHWGVLAYAVLMMTCFNFFSHGTQDLYPQFLQKQHHFNAGLVTALTICLNLGAILGGFIFGPLSERIGRRKAMALAAVLALPVIPLWAYSTTPLMLAAGAFLIQVSVQGAWGAVPAHLNELSPSAARATFPGFAYQLGNLFAAINVTIQTNLMKSHHGDYSFALAVVCAVVAVVLALVTWFGPEKRGVAFGETPA